MERKDYKRLLAFLAAIFIFLFFVIRGLKNDNKIRKNLKIINSKINSVSIGYRGTIKLGFDYSYKDKVYYGDATIQIPSPYRNYFLNKNFPLAIDSLDPHIYEFIFYEKDYGNYNLQYPDSLQWVLELKEKSSF